MSTIRPPISHNIIRICPLPMTLNTHPISSHMGSTTNQMEGLLSTSGSLPLPSPSTRGWHVSLRRKTNMTNFFPSHLKTSMMSWGRGRGGEQKTLSSRLHRLPLPPLRWEINLLFLGAWGRQGHLDFCTTTTTPTCRQGRLLRQMLPPMAPLPPLLGVFTGLLISLLPLPSRLLRLSRQHSPYCTIGNRFQGGSLLVERAVRITVPPLE